MKKVFLTLITLGFSMAAMAQTSTIENVSSGEESTGSLRTRLAEVTAPMTFSLKTEASGNFREMDKGEGGDTETQLRFGYKMNDQWEAGLLLGGKFHISGEAEAQNEESVTFSDMALAAKFTGASILNADKTVIDLRVALPTSAASYNLHKYFQLRGDLVLPYTLANDRSVGIWLSGRGHVFETKASEVNVYSQLRASQGKDFVAYAALNHELRLVNQKAGLSRTVEAMGPELGLEVAPTKELKIALAVAQKRNILNPTESNVNPNYTVFDEAETEAKVSAQIRL
jgi:hypothetical protein